MSQAACTSAERRTGRIGRIGISSMDQQSGRSLLVAGTDAENVIVRWIKGKQTSMSVLLAQLVTADCDSRLHQQSPISIAHSRRRLSLALFCAFCKDQHLLADEVALLLVDAQQAANEALHFLITKAAMEPSGLGNIPSIGGSI